MNTSTIAAVRLIAFTDAVLSAVGLPAADAHLVADSLVQADLWGHQSHGVMRLSWYVARIRAGVVHAVTQPDLIVDAGAVAVLDGKDGVGQVIAAGAAHEALRRAKVHGIGAVAVRNSNHFGTAAYFTRMAPPEGCIGLLTTNASPAMAPWGGRKKIVGNNPWSVAAPAGSHPPMVLDIANTVVARGKVFLARQKGLPIPAGWAISAAGEPTTDPAEALAGIILPMGEHKGYSISVALDVLSGVLTGSGFGTGVHGPYQTEHRSGCGHLMIALNIEAFLPLAEFNARMEKLIAELKSVPLAKGFKEVFYPGEIEARNEERCLREGLRLPEQTLTDLAQLAKETGREALLPF
ncbi:MAG: Ldh family oxidoreductase [Deltaproteobacteria bacterium]|nr:Ldh family oxidoreductase [Deltaproteobacteria bacterium]